MFGGSHLVLRSKRPLNPVLCISKWLACQQLVLSNKRGIIRETQNAVTSVRVFLHTAEIHQTQSAVQITETREGVLLCEVLRQQVLSESYCSLLLYV
jgi:hypothetical protein